MNRRSFLGRLVAVAVGAAIPAKLVALVTSLAPKRGGLTLAQILAVSYPRIRATMSTSTNAWAENAFLRELEKQGYIARTTTQPLQMPLEFIRNP